MTLVYSFLFCGLVCLIGQIILDNTKITPGHLLSGMVALGAVLGAFNIYDRIVYYVGIGANLPIMSFGNVMVNSAYQGFLSRGFMGLIGNMLSAVSVGIVAAIICAFIMITFAKVKD